MIKIIGTTHLDSKEKIEGILKDENPDIIAIELCHYRENAILNEPKDIEEKSLLGKITSAIKKKAKEENLDYGSDMKSALIFARENGIKYEVVDMPILKIQELFTKIPKEEQEGFARELAEFNSVNIKDEIKEEELVETLKERYPIAFEFLINMRNLYIANQLLIIERDNPNKNIVAILGKGHVKQVNLMIRNKR